MFIWFFLASPVEFGNASEKYLIRLATRTNKYVMSDETNEIREFDRVFQLDHNGICIMEIDVVSGVQTNLKVIRVSCVCNVHGFLLFILKLRVAVRHALFNGPHFSLFLSLSLCVKSNLCAAQHSNRIYQFSGVSWINIPLHHMMYNVPRYRLAVETDYKSSNLSLANGAKLWSSDALRIFTIIFVFIIVVGILYRGC